VTSASTAGDFSQGHGNLRIDLGFRHFSEFFYAILRISDTQKMNKISCTKNSEPDVKINIGLGLHNSLRKSSFPDYATS